MASLTFGTGIIPGADARLSPEVAGQTPMSAGQGVYRDPATGRVLLAQNNNVDRKELLGVLTTGVTAIGQPVLVQTEGEITGATGLTKGEVYVLSATAGSFCPIADLVTTNFVTVAAVATSTTALRLRPFISGAIK